MNDFLTLAIWPPNYLIGIFTHLQLCLADAIYNLSEWKPFSFEKIELNDFEILLIYVTF